MALPTVTYAPGEPMQNCFDKINGVINAANSSLDGGAAGQILSKASSTEFDANWIDYVGIPSQTSNSGKVLTTDGTTPSWERFPIDKQKVSSSPNSNFPLSGEESSGSILAQLTTAVGPNRDYTLMAAVSFKITSGSPPDTIFGFFNGSTLLFEWISVARNDVGAATTTTIPWIDLDVAPGTVYNLKIRDASGTTHVNVENVFFGIEGSPS